MRVLFVTTEMDDFVRVGGLAAVSAALPRALRSLSDVRIILPGYRDVVEQFLHIEIVGQCAPLADMPACSLGLTATKDGLPVYVLLCPQLYDRPGNPYGDASGRDWPDNDVRFGRFASAAAQPGTLGRSVAIIAIVVASLAIVAIAKYQRVVQPAITHGLAAATGSGDALANLESDTLISADKAIAAPEFAQGNWINSDALTLDKLRGRVVLVEFWTFGCYNCRNTLPSVKE